jgi:hypothetical protein
MIYRTMDAHLIVEIDETIETITAVRAVEKVDIQLPLVELAATTSGSPYIQRLTRPKRAVAWTTPDVAYSILSKLIESSNSKVEALHRFHRVFSTTPHGADDAIRAAIPGEIARVIKSFADI